MTPPKTQYCVMCGDALFRTNNVSKARTRRSPKARTCSRACSRRYSLIIGEFYNKIRTQYLRDEIIVYLQKRIKKLKGGSMR